MNNQTLLMPTSPAVAGGLDRDPANGRFRTKRDIYMVVHPGGGPHRILTHWSRPQRVHYLNKPVSVRPGMDSQLGGVTHSPVVGKGEYIVVSERLAAVRAFKGGAALLAVGAIAAGATLIVSAPFLPGVSAVLTMVGGTIAAGATERYRRAG